MLHRLNCAASCEVPRKIHEIHTPGNPCRGDKKPFRARIVRCAPEGLRQGLVSRDILSAPVLRQQLLEFQPWLSPHSLWHGEIGHLANRAKVIFKTHSNAQARANVRSGSLTFSEAAMRAATTA